MPQTALSIPLPLTASTRQEAPFKDHPALKFYSLYGQSFPKTPDQWSTVNWEAWYAADLKIYRVDRSVLEGGEEGWKWFKELYGSFSNVEREFISLIVVSDEEKGAHTIHIEVLTKLPTKGGIVEWPQSFAYKLGKADEERGTVGLQFRELRCYYDMRIWEEAMKMQR